MSRTKNIKSNRNEGAKNKPNPFKKAMKFIFVHNIGYKLLALFTAIISLLILLVMS